MDVSIINYHGFMRYSSYQKAEAIASANSKDDPDWTYVPHLADDGHWMIRVADEDGSRGG